MLSNFKSTFKKKSSVMFLAVVAMLSIATSAGAAPADMTAVTTSITEEFTGIVTAALIVLGSVAAAGLILFGGIYAWKYGKKVFNVISK